MPEPITVWAARLGDERGEVKGTLSLSPDELVFRHEKGQRHVTVPVHRIRSVRRGFGSPVLIVHWDAGEEVHGLAVFFAQPPPLEDPAGGRRRTHRRKSAQYLIHENANKRSQVKEWRRTIRAAAREAGRGE